MAVSVSLIYFGCPADFRENFSSRKTPPRRHPASPGCSSLTLMIMRWNLAAYRCLRTPACQRLKWRICRVAMRLEHRKWGSRREGRGMSSQEKKKEKKQNITKYE